jgi:adenosylcobinamide kinase/adenosylcobinamide-phosphate guanylyltransferase
MRILLVGGSKSGKSSLAQSLTKKLAGASPCIYWATMEPTDREDDERIERHIEDRAGLGFITIERGRDIAEVALPEDASVLFDSVTALLANETFGSKYEPEAYKKVSRDILTVSRSCRNFVCVADELFRDGSIYDETTEGYRRGLAFILRELARDFDAVAEVSCGIPKLIKGVLPE